MCWAGSVARFSASRYSQPERTRMITCLTALVANPPAIRVPGTSTLSFAAAVVPDAIHHDPSQATADVKYEIVDKGCRICFANGRKSISIRALVTASGNRVTHHARLVCCGGGP